MRMLATRTARRLLVGAVVTTAGLVAVQPGAASAMPVHVVGWNCHVANGDPMIVPQSQWVWECTPIWGSH